MTANPPHLLTVGDGDISFSLSLKRAYPDINITASTLVESPTELCKLYSNAAENILEFEERWKEQIIYKVDATHLKETIRNKYDMVLFNHPHLGDSSLLKSESLAAQRHHSLLSHYFHSAVDILSEQGRIHVCLSGNQPRTWNLIEAATNCGLKCLAQESTSCPISKWLFQNDDCHNYQLADAKSHYKPPRKFRNGKLGSKHFLARYGYRHRRTEGDLFKGDAKEMNVQESVNFVFAIDEEACKLHHVEMGANTCNICRVQFDRSENLRAHLRAPALPDVAHKSNPMTENENVKCSSLTEPSTKLIDIQDDTVAEAVSSVNAKTEPPGESIDIKDATLVEANVEKQYDSKRLKNVCRQEGFPLSTYIKSKSQVENAIKNGRVFVNGVVAFDTGRVLRENDVVTLVNEEHDPAADGNSDEVPNNVSVVQFEKEIASSRTQGLSIVIANKPVGMRCVGSFASTTLQMKTQKHYECSRGIEKLFCHPVTKLDTGCAGLCALAISQEDIGNLDSLRVCYTFTTLVHGRLPETWKNGIYAKTPTNGVRQWKRQKKETNGAEDLDPSITLSTTELDLENAIFIKPVDVLSISGTEEQNDQFVSTLTASSRHDDGRLANVIPYVLRKLGHPVVNDRFAKREYSCLPRKMKNILKQKMCIGCYSLDVEFEGVTQTVATEAHKRTQCIFWRHTLER